MLNNPLIQAAFGSAETDILRQMYAVKLDDKEAHTRLVLALQTSKCVNRYLWSVIQDGHAATEEIRIQGRRID